MGKSDSDGRAEPIQVNGKGDPFGKYINSGELLFIALGNNEGTVLRGSPSGEDKCIRSQGL